MTNDVEQILEKYEDWEDVLGRPLREIVADMKDIDSDALSLVSTDDNQKVHGGLILLRGPHTERLLEVINDEIDRIRAEEAGPPPGALLH